MKNKIIPAIKVQISKRVPKSSGAMKSHNVLIRCTNEKYKFYSQFISPRCVRISFAEVKGSGVRP
jgi:hypothetical protein